MEQLDYSEKLLLDTLIKKKIDYQTTAHNIQIIFNSILSISPKTIENPLQATVLLNLAGSKNKHKKISQLLQGMTLGCLKFPSPQATGSHICLNYHNKNYYFVLSKCSKMDGNIIKEKEYIENFGLIHHIALNALINQVKENRNHTRNYRNNNLGLPALIISPFERVGSTLITDILDYIARGHTEPFRQHIGTENPLCPINQYYGDIDINNYHPELAKQNYSKYWINNFYASLFSVPEIQVIKETNIFFLLNFVLKLLPSDTPIIFLFRDFRGIISSFKKNDLYHR